MAFPLLDTAPSDALPIVALTRAELDAWRASRSDGVRQWLDASRFEARPGSHCLIPGADGAPAEVLVGMAEDDWLWSIATLAGALGPRVLRLPEHLAPEKAAAAALGFVLGAYRFTRYGKSALKPAQLVLPEAVSRARIEADARATFLVRDLINTSAADMMPEDLADAAANLAHAHGGHIDQIVGDALLEEGYPAVHAVGRASAHAPRLLDVTWGPPDAPPLTLVGKGVCFDSGGLDIKSATGMRLMKKDMGGAAHVLGLASRIMDAKLPVRLRVLIPAVENAISGSAFRPGDVLNTRAGITVEIDNTDAEGRLILCDALYEASSARPLQIIDYATLTGAARVALGTDLPALFSNDDDLAHGIAAGGAGCADPVWRMPLHAPYRDLLESRVADTLNSTGVAYAGAITAALYLERFVDKGVPWAHFDVMAWNLKARPGRPEGGEAMGLRAVFAQVEKRFAEH